MLPLHGVLPFLHYVFELNRETNHGKPREWVLKGVVLQQQVWSLCHALKVLKGVLLRQQARAQCRVLKGVLLLLQGRAPLTRDGEPGLSISAM